MDALGGIKANDKNFQTVNNVRQHLGLMQWQEKKNKKFMAWFT